MSKPKRIREHLSNFNIAGFGYYEGSIVFSELKIGTELELLPEPYNKYDSDAIAIYFQDTKLGFMPRDENRMIAKLLKLGFTNFEVRVQKIDPTEDPEAQVRVILFAYKLVDNSN